MHWNDQSLAKVARAGSPLRRKALGAAVSNKQRSSREP